MRRLRLLSKHSYALRVVVVIVYFHKKFQRGSAKTAWMEFQNAVQFENESIEDWTARLDSYFIRLRRYGTTIPFAHYLEQWCTGSNRGFFLNELRKAKNPATVGAVPLVHDMISFQNWRATMLDNLCVGGAPCGITLRQNSEKQRRSKDDKQRRLRDDMNEVCVTR